MFVMNSHTMNKIVMMKKKEIFNFLFKKIIFLLIVKQKVLNFTLNILENKTNLYMFLDLINDSVLSDFLVYFLKTLSK